MDLRLTAEQTALREDATAFCGSVRPLLEADPEWFRQGMLSDGDSAAVNKAFGERSRQGCGVPEYAGMTLELTRRVS